MKSFSQTPSNPPWIVQELSYPDDLYATVEAYCNSTEFVWLDTGDVEGRRTSSTSLIASAPINVVDQSWQEWARLHKKIATRPRSPGPLPIGWVGYLGFESADQLEDLPQAPSDHWQFTPVRMGLYDRAVMLDSQRRRAWLVLDPTLSAEFDLQPVSAEQDIERWEAVAKSSSGSKPDVQPLVAFESTPAEHIQRVRQALDYIAAGDIYQVNICQRLKLSGVGDPLHTFKALQQLNPAPYAGLVAWSDQAVVSASPELLLSYDGLRLLTQPIKGTRPRHHDATLDEAAIADLMHSEKDLAELNMIVDLHRNDLGRVAKKGTLRVQNPRRLETHPAVFHTVADIEAQLDPQFEPLDALRAMFPAGSIVGVPKIRALEIIRELEPVPRGAATGAVGVLGTDGRMSFNVAIRTLQQRQDKAVLTVGGGIVADSDPQAEYLETLDKARGLLLALRARGDALTMPTRKESSPS